MPLSLLKFQIGPVQDFIAQARSTRDLWSGSYLLSWLAAAGIRQLLESQQSSLIFPDSKDQPLLNLKEIQRSQNHKALLTPNLPNIFVARIQGDACLVANEVVKTIEEEWMSIAKAVWEKSKEHLFLDLAEERFFAQVKHHLSISWMATPLDGQHSQSYVNAYRYNSWHLDAVRQTRNFRAWSANGWETRACEKDSLTGKEEAVYQGSGQPNNSEGKQFILNKHTDYLGAVSFIKRVWHLDYLRDVVTAKKPGLKTGSKDFHIRSVIAIAARQAQLDDQAEPQEKTAGEKYIAAIAFDGDFIGQWVNGDFYPDKATLEQHHLAFSQALSAFALKAVSKVVEKEVPGKDNQVPLGELIYAGGDDVLCLVPADAALSVAHELREAFLHATNRIKGTDPKSNEVIKPDASVGIAIGHILSPLQDLVREAQRAQKHAKGTVGRPAFSVTLMRRSGEISQWGDQWERGGLTLYHTINHLLESGELSAKFPHRVCQLLNPYLTEQTGLSNQVDNIAEVTTAKEIIQREFLFAAERQGSKTLLGGLEPQLTRYLDGLIAVHQKRGDEGLQHKRTVLQELLISVIGLCNTVAFTNCNREPAPSSDSSDKHSLA